MAVETCDACYLLSPFLGVFKEVIFGVDLYHLSVSVAMPARAEPPRRHGSAEGLHRGVEEVLHPVRHPAQTLLSAGDYADGQTRQQQEDEHGGQHCPQGETKGMKNSLKGELPQTVWEARRYVSREAFVPHSHL